MHTLQKLHLRVCVKKFGLLGGSGPWSIKEYQSFPKKFLLLHCVPLYVCRLCINFQELCARLLAVCKATWNGYPSYSLLTFISRFLIDFLSIRKVIIFSAITTDDRHPLRSRSIHQNAANCMTIRFRYIAQQWGRASNGEGMLPGE